MVGDGRREEGLFIEPPGPASRSRRAWLCEAASPLSFLLFIVEEEVPFDEVVDTRFSQSSV